MVFPEQQSNTTECEYLLNWCSRILRGIATQRIKASECYYTVLVTLLGGGETCWPSCVAAFPAGFRDELYSYAVRYIRDDSFHLLIDVFLTGDTSDEDSKVVESELRPKFERLLSVLAEETTAQH